MKKIFIIIALLLCFSACQVPGKIHFVRNGENWEAEKVEIERENITPEVLKTIEDRLNGK